MLQTRKHWQREINITLARELEGVSNLRNDCGRVSWKLHPIPNTTSAMMKYTLLELGA